MLKLRGNHVKVIVLMGVIVVSILSLWLGFRAFLKTDYPLLAVTSVNMVPTLQFGDLIMVQGVSNACDIVVDRDDAVPLGDIIIFHNPTDSSELIVHRAIDKEFRGGMWYFQTKGDYITGPDIWDYHYKCDLAEEYVVGKVVGHVSHVGYIPLFLREFLWTPTGMLIVLILLLICSLYMRRPSLRKKVEAQNQAFINNSY